MTAHWIPKEYMIELWQERLQYHGKAAARWQKKLDANPDAESQRRLYWQKKVKDARFNALVLRRRIENTTD